MTIIPMNLFIVVCTLGNKSDDLYSSLLPDLSTTDRSLRKELFFAIHTEECWWFCRNIYNVGITGLLGAGVVLLQRGEINRHEMQPVLEEPIAFTVWGEKLTFMLELNQSLVLFVRSGRLLCLLLICWQFIMFTCSDFLFVCSFDSFF